MQNGCLLTAYADGKFDPEADLVNLAPFTKASDFSGFRFTCGPRHVIATDSDQTFIWGEHPATEEQESPIIHVPRLLTIHHVTSVSCGFDHTLLVADKVYGWGSNSQGQLGFAPKLGRTIKSPKVLEVPKSTIDVTAGVRLSFFVTGEGQAFACGFNKDWQLGCGIDKT